MNFILINIFYFHPKLFNIKINASSKELHKTKLLNDNFMDSNSLSQLKNSSIRDTKNLQTRSIKNKS